MTFWLKLKYINTIQLAFFFFYKYEKALLIIIDLQTILKLTQIFQKHYLSFKNMKINNLICYYILVWNRRVCWKIKNYKSFSFLFMYQIFCSLFNSLKRKKIFYETARIVYLKLSNLVCIIYIFVTLTLFRSSVFI